MFSDVQLIIYKDKETRLLAGELYVKKLTIKQ